jgi:hypothetical protein
VIPVTSSFLYQLLAVRISSCKPRYPNNIGEP